MSANPFAVMAGIAGREAELESEAEARAALTPDKFFVNMAAESGTTLRKRLLRQGIAMSPEDRMALRQQAVFNDMSREQGELVRAGADPMVAQELAINSAIASFLENGDWESAQSLLPGLSALQKQREELRKISAAGYKDEAAGDKAVVETEIARLVEARNRAKEPKVIEKLDAEIERLRAQAGYYGRMPRAGSDSTPAAGMEGGELAAKLWGKAKAEEHQAMMGGAFALYRSMEELSRFYDNPQLAAAATTLGKGQSILGQYMSGALQYVKSYTPSNYMIDRTKEQTNVGELIAGFRSDPATAAQARRLFPDAPSLQAAVTQYESLVINAAYAMARAADPGGRLSDNDFQFALQQLGAVQDPESAKLAFAAIANRGYNKIRDTFQGFNSNDIQRAYGEQLGRLEERRREFESRRGVGTVQNTAVQEDLGDKSKWKTSPDGKWRQRPGTDPNLKSSWEAVQ